MNETDHSTGSVLISTMSRRGFIGHVAGAFAATAIVGGTAVAVSDLRNMELMMAYRQWLDMEGRMLGMEMFPELGEDATRYVPQDTVANAFHFPRGGGGWQSVPKPSTRAGLVLSSVGLVVPGGSI